jgi:hypothetical protein
MRRLEGLLQLLLLLLLLLLAPPYNQANAEPARTARGLQAN